MQHAILPRIVQLADQLAADIDARGLKAGDPYYRTAEVARMLGVSTTTANRALQLLVHRKQIERRQGRQTVVSDATRVQSASLACIQLLVRREYVKTEGLLADGIVVGLQRELPAARIQFSFLPDSDEAEFISHVVSESTRAREPEGFLLARTSLVTQRLIHNSGLPAVVFGTPYPGLSRFSWIDRDQHKIGRLLMQTLLEADVTHVALLMRDRQFPGDHPFCDGIHSVANARIPLANWTTRFMASDEATASSIIQELLANCPGRLGILCRFDYLADIAVAVLARQPKRARDRVVIVTDSSSTKSPTSACAQIHQLQSPVEIGAQLAELLLRQWRDPAAAAEHRMIDVALQDGPNGVSKL